MLATSLGPATVGEENKMVDGQRGNLALIVRVAFPVQNVWGDGETGLFPKYRDDLAIWLAFYHFLARLFYFILFLVYCYSCQTLYVAKLSWQKSWFSVTNNWSLMNKMEQYPDLWKVTLNLFVLIYLCDSAAQSVNIIKSKYRSSVTDKFSWTRVCDQLSVFQSLQRP